MTHCCYAYFIGTTGVASFLNWKPGWKEDNAEIMYMSDDPEAPFRKAFEAAGYSYRLLGPDCDAATMQEAVMESLHRGDPVVAFGPLGPPVASIVTGYDEGGVLHRTPGTCSTVSPRRRRNDSITSPSPCASWR